MADDRQEPKTVKGLISQTQLTPEGAVMVIITLAVPPEDAHLWVAGRAFDMVQAPGESSPKGTIKLA